MQQQLRAKMDGQLQQSAAPSALSPEEVQFQQQYVEWLQSMPEEVRSAGDYRSSEDAFMSQRRMKQYRQRRKELYEYCERSCSHCGHCKPCRRVRVLDQVGGRSGRE